MLKPSALSRILVAVALLIMGSTAVADTLPPEQVEVLRHPAVRAALVPIGACFGECFTEELCYTQAMRYFHDREEPPTGADLTCAIQYLDRSMQLARIAAAVTKQSSQLTASASWNR